MRKILTAVTAAALALSLVAQATPANAVAGYDSAYAGESAFLTLEQGETGTFTVFFSNIGTTSWTAGTATQVDLAACLEDKLTCNAQDADEAEFNSGWQSATRYTAQTQTSVAPGQIGTFTYSVQVPADAAEAVYRFNGALVLNATGADIHNEGYYQDVSVVEGPGQEAATLDEIDPEEGSVEGGETVVLSGEGFVCEGITVLFGEDEADVVSCGETSITVETPAVDAADSVDVTVTNEGADASNALDFVFVDDVAPTFDSIVVEGQIITLTFSEPVCTPAGTLDDDAPDQFNVLLNGDDQETDSAEFADCDDTPEATATITITEDEVVEGDTVTVTITSGGADSVEDAAGNTMERAQTRTAEASADVGDPFVESVTAVDDNELEVDLSEPVICEDTSDATQFVFNTDSDETAIDVECSGDTITVIFEAGTFADEAEGDLEYTWNEDEDEEITDLSGNRLDDFDEAIEPLPAAQGEPTITDATVSAEGFTQSADTGDDIELTFSEEMDSETLGDVIRVQDDDGSVYDIECNEGLTTEGAGPTDIDADCEFDGDLMVLTITLLEGARAGNAIAAGDIAGLQWPAEIIDTANIRDDEGNDVNLEESEDVIINTE